jgi:Arc/MetJ-type ribon-helix-helix transcriptional regulator
MSYAFPPELHSLVQLELTKGIYQSEDDVLLSAVRLLHEQELYEEQFRADLKVRLDRLDRGEGIHFDSEEALQEYFERIMAEGQQRYDARQKSQ